MSFDSYEDVKRLLGERVQALRRERGITQEQLAELINKSIEHISFIERGERAPSFETILDLAKAFNVSVSYLMNLKPSEEISTTLLADLQIPVVSASRVQYVTSPVNTTKERRSDLEQLQSALQAIQELQSLAHEYGINDVFQKNGGKLLQVLILLGLRISHELATNRVIDAEGNTYEIKIINKNSSKSIAVHPQLNLEILARYRSVQAWYIAVYQGIELKAIYKILPAILETKFRDWESRISSGIRYINNPKISLTWVERQGELVYPKTDEPI